MQRSQSELSAVSLQVSVEELCKDDSHILPSFSDLLDSAVQKTFQLDGVILHNKTTATTLENAAVVLWNKTVLMKTKGSLTSTAIAKLRHVAFKMVTVACSATKEETSMKKQILMGMKTARAWIDCKQFNQAEGVLDLLSQMTQTLLSSVVERGNNSGTSNEERLSLEEYMLKITIFKAEVFSGQNKQEEAIRCFQVAKQLLSRFPKEVESMSKLCYNFGLTCYQDKQFHFCTVWLRESFDLGKEHNCIDAKSQARSLRLLASAYLELNEPGYVEKALDVVCLANKEYVHPAGLFLNLRILLKSSANQASVKAVITELLNHAATNTELCHGVILLLQQHNNALGNDLLRESLLTRYRNFPDYGRLLTAFLDLLMRTDHHAAKNFARECITAHNTDCHLDAPTVKHLHVLFWERAARLVQENKLKFRFGYNLADAFYLISLIGVLGPIRSPSRKEEAVFPEAVDWYNYSFSLLRSEGGDNSVFGARNVAKLHRNRASCYLALRQASHAREALCEAREADPADVHTHFLFYKLALMESDTDTAKLSLENMVKYQSTHNTEINNDLIRLAAQMAIDQKRESLAAVALGSLVACLKDGLQALKALRCLVGLRGPLHQGQEQPLARDDIDELLPQIRTASNKLVVLAETDGIDRHRLQTEAVWFAKTAWNLALKCEAKPSNMKEFFTLCCRLLSLCEQDEPIVSQRKTCLFMAAATCIHLAKAGADSTMRVLLEEALRYISEHKTLGKLPLSGSVPDKGNRQMLTLLLLYEFEARVKLGDSKAEATLESALVLPNPQPKLFESFAALAVDPPAQQTRLSMRALKVAIHTHLQSEQPDFVKCSKDIHHLIEQSLTCNEAEAFTFFNEAADILDKKAQGKYPQIETVWLMTKSWNTGIRHFCCGSYAEAERWCAMSMKLLPHIGSLRDPYEDQMMSVYTEILEGMESQRSRSMEE